MMRRLILVLFISVLSSLALVAPVSADGSITSTTNFHGSFPPFHVDATCGAPAGWISATGNAVFHTTINGAGDFWFTTTQEASFTFVPDDATLPNFAGQFAAWFGVSDNNRNSVLHGVINVQATATDGSGASFTSNFVEHMSVSAAAQVNMFLACH